MYAWLTGSTFNYVSIVEHVSYAFYNLNEKIRSRISFEALYPRFVSIWEPSIYYPSIEGGSIFFSDLMVVFNTNVS